MNWSGHTNLKGHKEVPGEEGSSLLFLKYLSSFPEVINSADGEIALEVNEKQLALGSIDWNFAEGMEQPDFQISGLLPLFSIPLQPRKLTASPSPWSIPILIEGLIAYSAASRS